MLFILQKSKIHFKIAKYSKKLAISFFKLLKLFKIVRSSFESRRNKLMTFKLETILVLSQIYEIIYQIKKCSAHEKQNHPGIDRRH